MTIKDVEERTGLSRSNIRFYEKEKLIEPSRNESNGYRDYSENDVENIRKIAYLRTLGISIEDIRSIISEKVTLQEMLEKQKEVLKNQITDLNKAKLMCEKMLDEESISYEKLQVEQYVTDLHDYWKDNRTVFKLDSVSFLYIWGSMLTWTMITALCLIIGALSYSKLPTEIPVQWSKGVATSLVNKNWIFICPVICIIIRYLLKTFYLCEIADEQLLWRNYNRVFDKLYVFYCVVSGNLLHTFYFRSGKKCCCTAICGHGNFYWIVSSWFGKNGFERERSFMIQILYFRNNNKILFFPRLL